MDEAQDFFSRLSEILKQDTCYKQDAYFFVMASLSRAVRHLKAPRHVTGPELLKHIQEEAEEQFGPMAVTVFEHWGVKNSLDFGYIVFNMVREGILSKTEADALEDFKDAVFFQNLFDSVSGYRLQDEESALNDIHKNSQ